MSIYQNLKLFEPKTSPEELCIFNRYYKSYYKHFRYNNFEIFENVHVNIITSVHDQQVSCFHECQVVTMHVYQMASIRVVKYRWITLVHPQPSTYSCNPCPSYCESPLFLSHFPVLVLFFNSILFLATTLTIITFSWWIELKSIPIAWCFFV